MTRITTFSTRTCLPGTTYLRYRQGAAWAPCPSLTANPRPLFPDSISRTLLWALLPPSSQNTGLHSPTIVTLYSHVAPAHPQLCLWKNDAARRPRPSLTGAPGCCMSATPPSMTTCQKRNFTPLRRSPFSHPSPPCLKPTGDFLSPSTWPARMQMSPQTLRHFLKRKTDTVSGVRVARGKDDAVDGIDPGNKPKVNRLRNVWQ